MVGRITCSRFEAVQLFSPIRPRVFDALGSLGGG